MAEHQKNDGRESPASESLLTFNVAFDFGEFVREKLIPSEGASIADMIRSTAKMIGQERDGNILLTWDKKNNTGDTISCVGLYSPSSKSYRTLYQHDSQTTICAATVNGDLTLLAFTVLTEMNDQKCYDCFIAEIRPQERVFTLNLEGPQFRMLQFLHSDTSSSKNRMGRNVPPSRLLLVIPNNIICQYQFRMQQVRQGAIVVSQPEQEIIQRNFVWYQWDPKTQWLYYARFEGNIDQSMSGRNSLTLHCKSFASSVPQHLFTLSLPLPLPYKESLYTSSMTYYDSPFAFRLPVEEINLQVLYRPDGFWCVCLQHCTGGEACDSESKIDYSIYIFHNGYTLYAQVPLPAPTSEDMYIHFMLIGCFVAAYIPGVMLHFLNIGPRVDPCHHLMFGSDMAIPLPIMSSEDQSQIKPSLAKGGKMCPRFLSSVVHIGSSPASNYNAALMDCNESVVYECVLNVPGFFHLFKTCDNAELMEDLLHLMIVGFQRNGIALSMIEHMCRTPMQMSDHRLIAEFIIASSFSRIYYECKHYVAKQLPLTTSPTFRGKIVKNSEGGKLALLKLSPIQNFIKQLLVQSDQRLVAATPEDLFLYDPPADQPFEILVFNAVVNQPSISRIDIRELVDTAEAEGAQQQSQAQASSPGQGSKARARQKKKATSKSTSSSRESDYSSSSGVAGVLRILTLSRRSNTSEQVRAIRDPRDSLTFLKHDEELLEGEEEWSLQIRKKMVEAVGKYMELRLKHILFNTVKTYYSDLEKYSCTVLQIIWESLGFCESNHPLHLSTICRQPTTKEEILFELLEAYQLAHLDLGIPLPNGFHTFFMAMGYLCLESGVFLQYLRNGVFTPTKSFMKLLIEVTSPEDAPVVFQVISNLDYSLAKEALDSWSNPTIKDLQRHTSTQIKEKQKRK